jgi:signal transduction histidine kinase
VAALSPRGDGFVHIEIRDNGVGIRAAALNTIFQRFTRAHTDDAAMLQVGGIGLGLSIVEDCILAMGGHIDVQSIESLGTTFRMKLPAKPA